MTEHVFAANSVFEHSIVLPKLGGQAIQTKLRGMTSRPWVREYPGSCDGAPRTAAELKGPYVFASMTWKITGSPRDMRRSWIGAHPVQVSGWGGLLPWSFREDGRVAERFSCTGSEGSA